MSTSDALDLPISFNGPYSFKVNGAAQCVFDAPNCKGAGLYIFAIEQLRVHRILYVGITLNASPRFRDHLDMYLCGNYRVYDTQSFALDVPQLVHEPSDRSELVLANYQSYFANLDKMLDVIQIFFAPLQLDKALLRRLESGLIVHLRKQLRTDKILENMKVSTHAMEPKLHVTISLPTPYIIEGVAVPGLFEA